MTHYVIGRCLYFCNSKGFYIKQIRSAAVSYLNYKHKKFGPFKSKKKLDLRLVKTNNTFLINALNVNPTTLNILKLLFYVPANNKINVEIN